MLVGHDVTWIEIMRYTDTAISSEFQQLLPLDFRFSYNFFGLANEGH